MSKPNELRQAIEHAFNELVQFERVDPPIGSIQPGIVNINSQWVKIHVPYGAILDAVIEALPDKGNLLNRQDTWLHSEGKWYLSEDVLLNILQAAKSDAPNVNIDLSHTS